MYAPMSLPRAWLLLVMVSIPTSLMADQESATKYAVMPLSIARGIDTDATKLLDELLLTELTKLASAGQSFLGSSDITAVIGLEGQKQMLSCNDESCMAELGNALGVDRLVSPSLGRMGDKFLFNVKIIDPKTIRVVKRQTITVDGNEGALPEGVHRLALEIIGQGSPASTSSGQEVERPPTSEEPIPEKGEQKWSVLRWVGVGTMALGTGLLVGGGVTVVVADATLGDPGSSGQDKSNAKTTYVGGLSGLGVGMVLLGSGVALFFLGG